MGHFSRCCALAAQMPKYGLSPLFVLQRTNEKLHSALQQQDFAFYELPGGMSWEQEAEHLANNFGTTARAVVLDLAHYQTLENLNGFSNYTKQLNSTFGFVAMIDGFRDTSISTRIPLHLGALIVPYLGAEATYAADVGYKQFLGAEFFIFQPEYEKAAKQTRITPEKAKHVLISMGGSDPYDLSLKVLQEIFLVAPVLSCTIIVGPGFSDSLRWGITHEAVQHESCRVVDSPASLAQYICEADIAISAAGLTKYEFAVCGTPAIHIPFNRELAEINTAFVQAGICKDLGVYTELQPGEIRYAIESLRDNKKAREQMAQTGKAIIPGGGTRRVLQQIAEAL